MSTILENGDKVIATARSADKLKEVYPEHTSNLHTAVLDLKSDPKTIKDTVDAACEVWGRIDCLVNNAGQMNIPCYIYASRLVGSM